MELWVGGLGGKQVAIDGKVSRGAKDSTTGKSTLHILRAWVSEASLSVGHEVCAEKSNELEALPRLLARLQLHGATVSIDAMGGHPDIAGQIQERGADYISRLKPTKKTRTEPSSPVLRACACRRTKPMRREAGSPGAKQAPPASKTADVMRSARSSSSAT